MTEPDRSVPVDGDALLAETARLVDVASVSHHEGDIVSLLESELAALDHLELVRVGDNLVARTALGRGRRLVLGGHVDTVPPHGNDAARLEDGVCWGLGSADMKGALAVYLDLARRVVEPAVDVTYVFYAREEVALEHSGLRELADERPDLLAGDVALLGEPTGGALEAGCQGSVRVRVVVRGERAHTARAWTGRNAIHRLADVLDVVREHEPRRPQVEGCRYHEALQAVAIEGGVAGNVVPDEASVTVAYRFAPDRDPDQAEAWLRALLGRVLEPDDEVVVTDVAPPARPGLDHPLVRRLVDHHRVPVRAKLGWTDVAFFAERGVPASNFGPGDPLVAHTAREHVTRDQLVAVHAVLADLLVHGA